MKCVVLCILDGWGESDVSSNNGIACAQTPVWDDLKKRYPTTQLQAAGLSVGLPEGQMGNSEVGHMTLGLGRVVLQDLPRIDQGIETHDFQEVPQFVDFIRRLDHGTKRCHLLGLLSPGGVHSHTRHMLTFAKVLASYGFEVCVHAFLDGRDTAPHSGLGFVQDFLVEISDYPSIHLSTLGGRYYGMDRDGHWDRIEKAIAVIAMGEGPCMGDPTTLLQDSYRRGVTDEFIPPHRHMDYHGFCEGDGLLMANFRSDRVRQILSAILLPDFSAFKRSRFVRLSAALGLGTYTQELLPYIPSLFPKQSVDNSLGEIISRANLKQLRLAETEKYPHVTFFFNGGQEAPFPGEDRILISSPAVETYDLCPEMSAEEITDKAIESIHSRAYALIVMNYANPDMVGHTGVKPAILKAIETTDHCLGRLVASVKQTDTILLITADHGNAEQMDITAHTTNPVPLIIVNGPKNVCSGTLADIAPTILDLMGVPVPEGMRGRSLWEGENAKKQ